jgi:hypothetical protein
MEGNGFAPADGIFLRFDRDVTGEDQGMRPSGCTPPLGHPGIASKKAACIEVTQPAAEAADPR